MLTKGIMEDALQLYVDAEIRRKLDDYTRQLFPEGSPKGRLVRLKRTLEGKPVYIEAIWNEADTQLERRALVDKIEHLLAGVDADGC